MRLGEKRHDFRIGCAVEFRILECEACGQQQTALDPVEPPAPGFRWVYRCCRCGSLVQGRAADGESPLNPLLEVEDGSDLVIPGFKGGLRS